MTIGRERMAWQRWLLEAERRIGELEKMLEKSGVTDLATALTTAMDAQAWLADAERLGMR